MATQQMLFKLCTLKVIYFCVGAALRPNENLHGTKTKISHDVMMLSPFCKLHLIANSICKLMISVIY